MQSEDKIQEFWPPALLHTTTSSSEDSSLFNCENEAVHDADGFSSSLAWAAPSEADGFGLASPELPELVQVVTTLEPTSPCNRSNLQLSPTLQVDAVELEFRNITCSLDVFQSDLASPPLQPVIQGCQSIRKQRRREQNRRSQQAYRQRRDEQVEKLVSDLEEMRLKFKKANEEREILKTELNTVKTILAKVISGMEASPGLDVPSEQDNLEA